MRAPTVALLCLFVGLALSGCSGSDNAAAAACADLLKDANGSNAKHTKIRFETTQGSFSAELLDDKTPITAGNFKTYVQDGFYDHVVFHRVVKGFMMQGGKFDNGTQKAKQPTHPAIKNEASAGCSNIAYTLSMARTNNPDSAQTEFFVNFRDNTFLNASAQSDGYAVFGIVYEGRDVVQKIENVSVHVYDPAKDPMCQPESGGTPNCPNTPVEMKSVKVI